VPGSMYLRIAASHTLSPHLISLSRATPSRALSGVWISAAGSASSAGPLPEKVLDRICAEPDEEDGDDAEDWIKLQQLLACAGDERDERDPQRHRKRRIAREPTDERIDLYATRISILIAILPKD
jgi:hypothetical protein